MEDTTMDETALPESNLDETALPESDILDANIVDPSIDDLFGEATDALAANGLVVTLPSVALPPELIFRVAEAQTRGCCTKLAWSNTGSIAQIVDDGHKISFRAPLRDPRTGVWSLTDESKHPIISSDDVTWEHIQFSNLGIELAAVDSLGRVFVYTALGALGRMHLAHESITRSDHPRPDLNAVVGMHWLPTWPVELKFPNITPATKIGDRWSTRMQHPDPNLPSLHHPVEGRNAMLYVSRDARITLMYPIDTVWHAVDERLDEVTSSADLLSHAAMGAEDDHLIVVTHDLSKRFRLYKVSISWNLTQIPKPGGQLSMVAPTLTIAHLTILDHVSPRHADTAKLSQLHIVPPVPSHLGDQDMPSGSNIFAIFTHASLPIDVTQQNQEAFSIIARWHVDSAMPTLHEAFSKLKKNGGTKTSPQNTQTSLKRQEDVFTAKVVLSFASQSFNTMLAFAASDGTIEFRERSTLASIEPYPDSTTVANLPQSGFEYLIDQHYTNIAMSGDGSSLAAVRTDGSLAHKMMTLRYSWHPVMDDGLLEAALVCLARQYAILCCTNTANDEILALLPLNLSSEMQSLFVKETVKMLHRSLDISMQDAGRQQMAVVREGLLSKAMSAQHIVCRKPGTTELTVAGKYGFAFLNMRLVGVALAQIISKPEFFSRPDYLLQLRGMMKWGSDLLIWVTNGLVGIKRRLSASTGQSASDVCERFIAEENSPVVHMLLCTFSRTYLRFLVSSIPKYLAGVSRIIAGGRSAHDRQKLTETFEMGVSMPFRYNDFDAFITAFDTSIRNAYTQGAVTAGKRTDIELSTMCCDLATPEELRPVLQELFDSTLPKFLERVDQSKLYFWDTTWLGIDSERVAQQYDVIQKYPLSKGMQLRVCRRCGIHMEDTPPEKLREFSPVLAYMSRHCACGDYWILK